MQTTVLAGYDLCANNVNMQNQWPFLKLDLNVTFLKRTLGECVHECVNKLNDSTITITKSARHMELL